VIGPDRRSNRRIQGARPCCLGRRSVIVKSLFRTAQQSRLSDCRCLQSQNFPICLHEINACAPPSLAAVSISGGLTTATMRPEAGPPRRHGSHRS
jgi:hypothetical protein